MNNVTVKKIVIKRKDGVNFSRLSGDNNSIHLIKSIGYLSQFGENIVHGSLILIKILKKIKIKNFFSINVNFLSFIKYDLVCEIVLSKRSNKKNIYKIYQEEELKIILEISNENNDEITDLKKITFEKKIKISNTKRKLFNDTSMDSNLKLILSELSKYVGVVYPGKNSLINRIKIIKKKNFSLNNLIFFKSNRLDKRFNLIENSLSFNEFFIDFKTSIRPVLRVKLKKTNNKIIKEIKAIKNNILIIGGSSGIGNDLLKLFVYNNKIKIISTYNKNSIVVKKKNVKNVKVNITKNTKKIFRIIKKYKPLNVYYFATPMINTTLKSKTVYNLYFNYYVKIPIKILKYCINQKNNFFYPSTVFIDYKNDSHYSYIKNLFEKKVKSLRNINNKINIVKIPRINTKHNLNILNEKLPNFRDIIFKNKEIRKKTFFNY